MPPGITPPLILNYNASTVPILQLALSGKGLSEQTAVRPRPELRPHAARHRAGRRDSLSLWRQGAPGPDRPRSRGAAGARPVGQDVANALAAQNQIIPAGTAKIGSFEYNMKLNNAAVGDRRRSTTCRSRPSTAPPSTSATSPMSATATRRSSNIVHVDGSRSVLMTVLKSGAASTLAIVDGVKDKLPRS